MVTQKIVSELVVPHFDARRMARQVLGKYRKAASEEQVERFTTEFAAYLVRYYSKAFANYDGETIKINDKVDFPSEKLATVKTAIMRNKGADVPVNYTLEKQDDQSWKIVDVAIEGIGLVQSKKEEYGGVIASSSLDKLISDLASINKSGGSQ
jgi:phospholipid transport system substrate-binding protein